MLASILLTTGRKDEKFAATDNAPPNRDLGVRGGHININIQSLLNKLAQGPANLFCRKLDNKYFRFLWAIWPLLQLLNSVILGQKQL